MKKSTAAIMVGIIVVLLLSIVIWATYNGSSGGRCGDNITWTLTNDGTLIISGEGETYNYGVRGGTLHYSATEPDWYNEQVESIVIEDGVTKIGYRVFSGLSNATSITIPESVTEIDDKAFENCGFTEIIIPDSVTRIGEYAFAGCDLTEIEIPDGMTEIGSNLFSDCNKLKSVKIPSSVTKISESAFTACSALQEIIVAEDNPNYSGDEYGVLYNKDKSVLICIPQGACGNLMIPASVKEIRGAKYGFPREIVKLKFEGDAPIFISASYNFSELTICYPKDNKTWTERVFQSFNGDIKWQPYDSNMDVYGDCGKRMTYSFTFDGVLTISGKGEIGDYTLDDKDGKHWLAFRDEIKSVIIEDGVTRIGDNAFCYCSNLSEVVIPDSVESIGERVFYFCDSLTELKIPASVTVIENRAFDGAYRLNKAEIAEDNPNYSVDESLVLYNKDGSELIDASGCTDKTYTVPANVTTIRAGAFEECYDLRAINVAKENRYYSSLNGALYNKDKTELVKVPRFIQRDYTIPESVILVKANAFADCSDLSEFRFTGDAPVFEDEMIFDEKATIYYPENNATWDKVIESYTGDAAWVAQVPLNTNKIVIIAAVVSVCILIGAGFGIYKFSNKKK